jgi:3-hydroxy-9,10-secoandrosta-1,3,5(10)-triene-9,17-dione monooxygenase reductase component
MIRERGGFCINALAHDQELVSARLAAKGPGKLESLEWRPSPNGSPILGGAIAWIDARRESEHPAGGYLDVISRVLDLAGSDAHSLIFFRGEYRRLAG